MKPVCHLRAPILATALFFTIPRTASLPQEPPDPLAPLLDELQEIRRQAGLEALERRVFDEINRIRRRKGLRRLRWHDELAAVSRAHSADMADRSYFDHFSPEGRNPADRTTAAGIEFARIAENIEYNLNAPDPVLKAVQDW